jgi:hypothetical protein
LRTQLDAAQTAERKAATQHRLSEALSQVELPEVILKRLQKRFVDAETDEGIVEAIREESDFLKELRKEGVVSNFGESDEDTEDTTSTDLTEGFKRLGLSDESAKIAVIGR